MGAYGGRTARGTRSFARRLEYDQQHAEHVRELSRQLFDELQPVHRLPPQTRVLLEAGALLHDTGHMISHRLRATFAVDLLTKGVPLEHVSKLLGHKSVITTERHYARWVKGRQDRLDSLVTESWGK